MNTNLRSSQFTEPEILRRKQDRFATRSLLFAVLLALAARSNESAAVEPEVVSSSARGITILQSYPGMPRLDYSKMPWLDYSKLPWLTQPARAQNDSVASAAGLLADLKADIESAASGLNALTDSLKNDQQNATVSGEATSLAVDYSTLLSQDLSTLLSQDLSVSYGQLLSTSLAVPTAPPRPNWNRQDPVVVRTPSGDVVLPTYPPRTAWGNGGMVVTTPGGAVFSVAPEGSQAKSLADSEALRDLSHQLEVVQNDVERLQSFLDNLHTRTNVPGFVLGPTGLETPKPGNPSDRLAWH